jgi:hypothetical protein
MVSVIKNKKGSHVGMVLSFVVFVTFLIFVFSALEPAIRTQRNLDEVLNRIEKNLLEYLSGNLSVAVIMNETPKGENNCLKINKSLVLIGENFIIKYFKGNIVNYNVLEEDLLIRWEDEEIYQIYSSNNNLTNHSSNGLDCPHDKTSQAVIRTIRTKEYIFWDSVENFSKEYNESYESLKEKLGISQRDFGFKIEYMNRTIIKQGTMNKGERDVFIKENSFEYVNKNAEISLARMYLEIW